MEPSAALNSWKEISNYIGRGVRTVQRWERDFGLPVRRPSGHLKGSVLALRADIDQWLSGRRHRDARAAVSREAIAAYPMENRENVERLHRNMATLKERCSSFGKGTAALEDTLKRTEELHDRIRARRAQAEEAAS